MPRFSKSHKLETALSSETSSCDTTYTGSLSILSRYMALKFILHNLCPGTFPAGPANTQPSTVDTATGESPVSPRLTSPNMNLHMLSDPIKISMSAWESDKQSSAN